MKHVTNVPRVTLFPFLSVLLSSIVVLDFLSISFLLVIPENAGSIVYDGNNSVELGTNIKIEAVSNSPYEFVRWSGDLDGSNNPIDIVASSDLNIVAEFQETNLTLPDSDKDGVPDVNDLCPDTEEGNYVNESGCLVINEFDQSYTQVWGDEFNYDGKPDPELWHHQVLPPNPNGGWWNGELQHLSLIHISEPTRPY